MTDKRLIEVQDPFHKLIANAKGTVVLGYGAIAWVAEAL
jgi:hypothetical protein